MSYVTEIVCIRRADVGPLKICSESILKLFPTSNGVFGKAFEPMPGWPLKLEGQLFYGVEVISSSHVYVEDVVLDPDSRACCSVVCLYVYGFESRWKFIIQNLIGET